MTVESPAPRIPLSVLELAPVGAAHTSREALMSAVEVARYADRAGYARFWVAEHHNMPGVAATSPAVLIAQVAATTSTIRVGSGGVMLPNHAPLVVAEQFAMLEALHPGRIDLGIGRAPGTDPATAAALRRSAEGLGAEEFPRELDDLLTLLHDPDAGLLPTPAATSSPSVWLLGSSGFSAQVAGLLGLPFAFAHHFSAANTEPALELYRSRFRPSAFLDRPYVVVTQSVFVAETREEAERLALPAKLTQLSLRTGKPTPLPSVAEAEAHEWTDVERHLLERFPGRPTIGAPTEVVAELSELAKRTSADELMVTTMTYGLEERMRSFELLTKEWGPLPDSTMEVVARR